MLHVSRRVSSPEDVATLFAEAVPPETLRKASGILVQLFWDRDDARTRAALCSEILRRAPGAILVGASSSGQVVGGALVSGGYVVSVACFERATLRLFRLPATPGREEEAGRSLAASLSACADLKATLLLVAPYAVDAVPILERVLAVRPSQALFGGGAVRGPAGDSGVLCGAEVSGTTVAAVALCGTDLRIETRMLFGWRPLGPEIRLTEADRCVVRRIDGRPAFGYFEGNLGIKDPGDLNLLEFPLLVERDGALVARNTQWADGEGGVRVGGDVRAGETARLGYLDVGALDGSVESAVGSLRAFEPEGVFLYSCACRLYTLQDRVESETLPFEGLAPTTGFFTGGEICGSARGSPLLNSSEIVVALREGPPSAGAGREAAAREGPGGRSKEERHARTTSHLFSFIGALTERIEEANRELSLRNAELAAGNERLRREIDERRAAEEHEKKVAAEKEFLLRELQHRVKNSLALISSIAGIEAAQAPAPEARRALGKLQSRIEALAALYDILYVSGDLQEIGLGDYIGRVVDYAAEGLGADAKGISIRHRLGGVRIDVKRAIAIGLAVNELVTDGIKHAFPGGRAGEIEVRLSEENGSLVVRVEDNGVGVPPAVLASPGSGGFGLTLVSALAAQLGAELSIRNEGGAKFALRLRL